MEGWEWGLEWEWDTEKQTKYWARKGSQRSNISNVSNLTQVQASGIEGKCLEAYFFS